MTGVVFFFEENDVDVWSGRRIDFDAWCYAIKAAGDIDKAIIINKTNLNLLTFDVDMDIKIVDTLPELSGKLAYIVCPWDKSNTKQDLWSFNHEVDWYLFGPAKGWISCNKSIDFGVCVPMNGRGALHAVHIASTVLLHRYYVRNK